MERPARWRHRVAERVIELILEANQGRWPASVWDWRRVARRFGLTLAFVRAPGPFTACIIDDLLVVRWTNHPCHVLRWITHEVCEAMLNWEGEPPFHYLEQGSERHRIARLVENLGIASNRGGAARK